MQGAARYIVVRTSDLRLEIAGSITAAALSSAYSHIDLESKYCYKLIE